MSGARASYSTSAQSTIPKTSKRNLISWTCLKRDLNTLVLPSYLAQLKCFCTLPRMTKIFTSKLSNASKLLWLPLWLQARQQRATRSHSTFYRTSTWSWCVEAISTSRMSTSSSLSSIMSQPTSRILNFKFSEKLQAKTTSRRLSTNCVSMSLMSMLKLRRSPFDASEISLFALAPSLKTSPNSWGTSCHWRSTMWLTKHWSSCKTSSGNILRSLTSFCLSWTGLPWIK